MGASTAGFSGRNSSSGYLRAQTGSWAVRSQRWPPLHATALPPVAHPAWSPAKVLVSTAVLGETRPLATASRQAGFAGHPKCPQQAASVPGHTAPTPQRPHERGPLPGFRPPLLQREGEGSSGSPLPPPLRNRPRPGPGARARRAPARWEPRLPREAEAVEPFVCYS